MFLLLMKEREIGNRDRIAEEKEKTLRAVSKTREVSKTAEP